MSEDYNNRGYKKSNAQARLPRQSQASKRNREQSNVTKLQYQVNALKIVWNIMEAKEM